MSPSLSLFNHNFSISLLTIFLIFISIISLSLSFSLTPPKKKKLSPSDVAPRSNYTSYFLNSTIKTANDSNFDQLVARGRFHDSLILFTVRKCPVCNNIITSLENVENFFLKNNSTQINLKFLKVDVFMSGWTAMRFQLDRLPNLIYVTNNSYTLYPFDNITEQGIFDFIQMDKKNFLPFPKRIGYFDLFMKLFHVLSDLIKEKLDFWNEGLSWLVVVAIIILFCLIEYFIFKICCKRTKKDKDKGSQVHTHTHTHSHGSATHSHRTKDGREEEEKNNSSGRTSSGRRGIYNLGRALNNKNIKKKLE